MTIEPTIDVHLDPEWMDRSLRADVLAGLTSAPKELPPKWFYDDVGSELFDKITRLAEYYPTEAEREILRERASLIVALSGADTFVELGSGTSDKTRVLLEAFGATGQLRRFVPFDVSEGTLRDAAASIAATWPRLEVHGVVGDFDHHLGEIPGGGPRTLRHLIQNRRRPEPPCHRGQSVPESQIQHVRRHQLTPEAGLTAEQQ